MGAKNYKDISVLQKKLGRTWRFDDDGSIRHIVNNPVEIVSPILQGIEGEKELTKVCDILKEMEFNADNIACGTHVHLGASDFKPREEFIVLTESEMKQYMSNGKNVSNIIDIMYLETDAIAELNGLKTRRLLTSRYRKFAISLSNTGYRDGETHGDTKNSYRLLTKDVVFSGKTNRVRYFWKTDRVTIEKLRKENKDRDKELQNLMNEKRMSVLTDSDVTEYRKLENEYHLLPQRFKDEVEKLFSVGDGRYVVKTLSYRPTKNLINVFLFYYVFDNVFSGMLPVDRRENNSYCVPLSRTFTFDEINACESQEDFEKLWYKERQVERLNNHKSQHYNDSRYHNVNFHSLFNRHGTIEIRSHSGTTNPRRIILWTALHQSVLDAISSEKITRDDLVKIHARSLPLDKLAKEMCDLLKLEDNLKRYVYRLLNYFSGTSL